MKYKVIDDTTTIIVSGEVVAALTTALSLSDLKRWRQSQAVEVGIDNKEVWWNILKPMGFKIKSSLWIFFISLHFN